MSEELWTAVDDTIETLFLPDDPALSAALADSAAAGLPEIAVSPAQGKLLMLFWRGPLARGASWRSARWAATAPSGWRGRCRPTGGW